MTEYMHTLSLVHPLFRKILKDDCVFFKSYCDRYDIPLFPVNVWRFKYHFFADIEKSIYSHVVHSNKVQQHP